MPQIEMRKLSLSCFTDESRSVSVLIDNEKYFLTSDADGKDGLGQGYFSGTGSNIDFLAATRASAVDEVTFADWNSEILFGIDGMVYSGLDVVSCRVLDLVILRCLSVVTNNGRRIRKFYRVKLRDSVVPADPMYPWGTDFYKFMQHHLNRRRQGKGLGSDSSLEKTSPRPPSAGPSR